MLATARMTNPASAVAAWRETPYFSDAERAALARLEPAERRHAAGRRRAEPVSPAAPFVARTPNAEVLGVDVGAVRAPDARGPGRRLRAPLEVSQHARDVPHEDVVAAAAQLFT